MANSRHEHMKPQIWTMFAAASMSAGTRPKTAADNADKMLEEFSARFEAEDEEPE